MLTAGFRPPDTAALNVLISGMAARAWLTGTSLSAFQDGTAFLKSSQPGPCGSGISTVGSASVVVSGSA